jgi:hypothetical protein
LETRKGFIHRNFIFGGELMKPLINTDRTDKNETEQTKLVIIRVNPWFYFLYPCESVLSV